VTVLVFMLFKSLHISKPARMEKLADISKHEVTHLEKNYP